MTEGENPIPEPVVPDESGSVQAPTQAPPPIQTPPPPPPQGYPPPGQYYQQPQQYPPPPPKEPIDLKPILDLLLIVGVLVFAIGLMVVGTGYGMYNSGDWEVVGNAPSRIAIGFYISGMGILLSGVAKLLDSFMFRE